MLNQECLIGFRMHLFRSEVKSWFLKFLNKTKSCLERNNSKEKYIFSCFNDQLKVLITFSNSAYQLDHKPETLPFKKRKVLFQV